MIARLLLFYFIFIGACSAGDDAFDDSDDDAGVPIDFHSLCCNERCDFLLVSGEINWDHPTWHEAEAALGLEGETVVLTVSDEHAGPGMMRPDCYDVTIVADKAPGVSMQLEVDVLGDGENVVHA